MPAIDIGNAPFAGQGDDGGSTYIVLGNPANASGFINTVKIQVNQSTTTLKIGIFYLVSGTTYKCRSAVNIGAVTGSGTHTITGLNLAVQTGDFIGAYWSNGSITITESGVSGCRYAIADAVAVDDSRTYSLLATRDHAIYGESASPPAGGSPVQAIMAGVI